MGERGATLAGGLAGLFWRWRLPAACFTAKIAKGAKKGAEKIVTKIWPLERRE